MAQESTADVAVDRVSIRSAPNEKTGYIDRLTVYAIALYLVIFISAYLYRVDFAASDALLLQHQQTPEYTILFYTIFLAIITIVGAIQLRYGILTKIYNIMRKYVTTRRKIILAVLLLIILVYEVRNPQLGAILILLLLIMFFWELYRRYSTFFSAIFAFSSVLILGGGISNYGYFFLAVMIMCAVLGYLLKIRPKEVLNLLTVITCVSASVYLGWIIGQFASGIVLVVFSVYDYIAVFKTKHMQALADFLIKKKLPIMLMVGDSRYLENVLENGLDKGRLPERKAAMLGGGDIIIPSVVTTSLIFSNNFYLALFSLVGSFVGIFANMWVLRSGKFKDGIPALPLLAVAMLLSLGIGYVLLQFL